MTKLSVLDDFGQIDGEPVKRLRLENDRIRVTLISYGAAIQALEVFDANQSKWVDVVLGFDTLEGYRKCETNRPSNPYFGATVGRVANVIVFGKFGMDGKNYQLDKNNNDRHFLHGGHVGFDQRNWNLEVDEKEKLVIFSLYSAHNDQKLPGDLVVNVIYGLTDNEVTFEVKAIANRPTPINIVNHSYFNLAGHDGGASGLYDHMAVIDADRYMVVEEDRIVTGELRSVKKDGDFDLRFGRKLEPNFLAKFPTGGIDHNFCLNETKEKGLRRACYIEHLPTKRTLSVYTDQPGLQFYTGNFMPEEKGIEGKQAAKYGKHGGFCVETQNYPDAINHSNFPDPVLRPGKVYGHKMIFKLDF